VRASTKRPSADRSGRDTGDWRRELGDLVQAAPNWMRDLASDELHIGGFTNVQLEHPVLDVSGLADDLDRAERALTFFLAACVARGAAVARVHAGSGARGRELIALASKSFKRAIARIDGDNVALVRYFDVYLRAADEIAPHSGMLLARHVRRALGPEREKR